MSAKQTMTSDQKLPVGVTILDKGGERYNHVNELPPGSVVSIVSSNPSVVGVTMREDGLNADLSSDDIGTAEITIDVVIDGEHLAGVPDVTEVEVIHAAPGSANVTFGAPGPETP